MLKSLSIFIYIFNIMLEHIIAFMIYSYLGASLEHISYFVDKSTQKMLANPIITGFPLYGGGAYLLILVNILLAKFNIQNILLRMVIYGFTLSSLEYIVGCYVGAGKQSNTNNKINAWDYSNEFMNIDGKVSLRHFISWSVLGLILSHIHPIIINKILNGIA